MSKKTGWQLVGEIYVDSGSVMVGDPCYTQGADASNASKDWNEFLAKTWPRTFGEKALPDPTARNRAMDSVVNALENPGIGIVVSSGFGDGAYPVYVKYSDEGNWGKRVAELKIVFIDDEGNHPYDEDWYPEDDED